MKQSTTKTRAAVALAAAAMLSLGLTGAAHGTEDGAATSAADGGATADGATADGATADGSNDGNGGYIPNYNYRVLKYARGNHAGQFLTVCRNWSDAGVCGSGIGYLANGENTKSKYGWEDSDGYWLPSHCMETPRGPHGGDKGRWIKVRGAFGTTYTVRISCG